MNNEMKSMKDNDVWDLFKLSEWAKPIGCKWIYKTKQDSKINVEKYKAHIVTKIFTQKERIDYKEVFSPVSTKDSFRIIMALIAHYDLKLHYMDVKTMFLNGDIEETIYMVQPEIFLIQRVKKSGMQIKEIHLRFETSILSMVSKIWSSDYVFWF